MAKRGRPKKAPPQDPIETALGLLPEPTTALCHPTRPVHQDGMCRACYALAHLDPPRMLTIEQIRWRNELVELHKNNAHKAQLLEYARARLREEVPGFVDDWIAASKNAAVKGDSGPAERALAAVKFGKERVVDPPDKVAPDTGVRILIGIAPAGLPPEAMRVEVLSPETLVPGD